MKNKRKVKLEALSIMDWVSAPRRKKTKGYKKRRKPSPTHSDQMKIKNEILSNKL